MKFEEFTRGDFVGVVDRKSFSWKNLLGQEDERKLLGFLGTEVATTSGTSIDFTGIPSWVTEIEILFNAVTLSGTDNLAVQIGDSGGIETTSYVGTSILVDNAGNSQATSSTSQYPVLATNGVISGRFVLTAVDAGRLTWVESHAGKFATTHAIFGGGNKTLSAGLTSVRVKSSGTDTFTAGSLNIRMT